jgi:hypothetical protein
MAYIHAIAAGHLELTLYAVSMLVSALPEEFLLILMRASAGEVSVSVEGAEFSGCSGSSD